MRLLALAQMSKRRQSGRRGPESGCREEAAARLANSGLVRRSLDAPWPPRDTTERRWCSLEGNKTPLLVGLVVLIVAAVAVAVSVGATR